jgi:tRNA (guanine26-N2/guanine27-N2)-dimethyltransferase
MDKVLGGSPTYQLLAKEARSSTLLFYYSCQLTISSRAEHNFKRHPQSVTQSSKVKLVRYQQNPTPHWGPGTRAESGKRKRESRDD